MNKSKYERAIGLLSNANSDIFIKKYQNHILWNMWSCFWWSKHRIIYIAVEKSQLTFVDL